MRKIALITTSRADYGIQSRLVRLLQEDDAVEFFLIVTGSHLSESHGMTINEIERDGVEIAERIDLKVDDESDIEHIMARALVLVGRTLRRIKPEICILLGDRYEMFASAITCVCNGIPIAHIHGGETTEGAMDEVFRHSITKAANIHFTSCDEYRRRIIQLGETPESVFNVGSLGVEKIGLINFAGKDELSNELGIEFSDRNFLVTFHPVTLEFGSAANQINELLFALDKLESSTIVFTSPNADPESGVVVKSIREFVSKHSRAYLFRSLGMRRYFSLVRCVDAVVGNSSSGIIEVPGLGVPTINIGNRQKGRIQGPTIINCKPDRTDILMAINRALNADFKNTCTLATASCVIEGVAERIVQILKWFSLSNGLKKKFFDVSFCYDSK